jgi:hypothetical protein
MKYQVDMRRRWFVGLVMSVSIWTVSSCSSVNLIPHGIGSGSDETSSMPSKSRTESGKDFGLWNGDFGFRNGELGSSGRVRVDSLSVSDAVIVLAAAHRLCEERDSLRWVYMKALEREMSEVKRGIWIERAVCALVVILSLVW